MFKHLALAAVGAGLVACGGTQSVDGVEQYADDVSEIHDVSDMLSRSESGRVTLDLRSPEAGFHIRPGVDYSAVDVLCPGDRQMNLSRWVPELAAEFRISPSELEDGLFLYMPRGDVNASYIPVCEDGCYLHQEANRQWVCIC